MKINLARLNRPLQKAVRSCRRAADSRHISAFLVGGLVRDLILRRPNDDLDFVLEGDVPAVARQMARDLGGRATVYPQFLTATVSWPGGVTLDLATTRQEHYPQPGVLPDVAGGDLHDDLYRRDFTINAMAVSLSRSGTGELVDYYNGRVDLREKKIRVLHEDSFHDDPTRIFRAVRFEQRFGFSLGTKTARALNRALKEKALGWISPDRYFQELKKILRERHPVRALRRLSRLGVLQQYDLDLGADFRRLQRLEDRVHKLRENPLFRDSDLAWIYFMALTETKKRKAIEDLAQTFPLTRRQKKSLVHMRLAGKTVEHLSRKELSPSKVYGLLRDLPLDVIAYWRARYPSLRLAQRIDRYYQRDRLVCLQVNGRDLKKMKDMDGRTIGRILDELILRKIDENLCSRQEEWAAVRQIVHRQPTSLRREGAQGVKREA